MVDDFAGFAAKIDKIGDEFKGRNLERMLNILGKGAKDDANSAVSADLGDRSMSNWRRNKPIQIEARYDVRGDTVEVTPTGRSKGPWRVLEEGRAAGHASDLVLSGKVRKDGTRKAKSRGRTSGATNARGTWSAAEKLIAERTPGRAQDEFVKSLKRVF